jgi:DNA polymerase-3 subunit chi
MVEVGFYHLTRTPLEPTLGRLLERVLASGQRAVVLASSAERVEALNRALWTYTPDSFLPHGSAKDGHQEEQPVYLTEQPVYPNGASVLVLVDQAEAEPPPEIGRLLVMFDGGDEAAVGQARRLWQHWQAAGAKLVYWQQGERGWHKAREA